MGVFCCGDVVGLEGDVYIVLREVFDLYRNFMISKWVCSVSRKGLIFLIREGVWECVEVV